MKRTLGFLICAFLLLTAWAAGAEDMQTVKGTYKREIPFESLYPDNPVITGESSTTGLPYSGDYVPILMVVDNALEAQPQWGIGKADVVYQMPNAGSGATKLVALFADEVPESAGGARSARVPFIDLRESWDAVFVYAGTPPQTVSDIIRVDMLLNKYGVYGKGLAFDLIGSATAFGGRIAFKTAPHNLAAKLMAIRESVLASGYEFTGRPFLFTDSLPGSGEAAGYINVAHFGETAEKGKGNPASWASYVYDAEMNAYLRTTRHGLFTDYNDPETQLAYSNVIVQRTKFSYSDGDYVILREAVGTGTADIFTGGRYIAGGWYRESAGSRTVFVDEYGQEIALQRGKTFIVVTNDVTRVTYRAAY